MDRGGGPIAGIAQIGNIVYAGGFNGNIFWSTNLGSSWNPIDTIFSNGVTGLTVVGTHLFVISNQTFCRSDDSGATWRTMGTIKPNGIAVSDSTIFVTTSDVYRSDDFGATWTRISQYNIGEPIPLCANDSFLFFYNIYSGNLYRSTDKGATWQLSGDTLFSHLWNDSDTYVESISLVDGQVYVSTNYNGTTYNRLFRSTDNGVSWGSVSFESGANISSIFSDGTDLFAATQGEGIFRSSDGGFQWIACDSGGIGQFGYCFASDGSAILVGSDEGVFGSSDHGDSWGWLNQGLEAQAIWSLESNGSILYARSENRIFRTSDEGNTWAVADNGLPTSVDPIAFSANGPEMYISYEAYGVVRSMDSGNDWSLSSGWVDSLLGDPMSLLTTDHGVFAGTTEIFRSTNHGVTWDSVYSLGQSAFESGIVGFVSNDSIVVALEWDGNNILVSTDFGDSWKGYPTIEQVGGLNMDGHSILITTQDGIYRSRDYGATWDSVADWNLVFNADSYSLAVKGPIIFAGTQKNGVHVSRDSGVTWREPVSNLGSFLLYPETISESNVFAIGADGGIYKSSLAQLSVASQSAELGGLSVFPNPMSSVSNIKYYLPVSGSVSFSIIDPLGRIVTKPLNGELQEAGHHEIQLDASKLTPGIYLCSLSAGGVAQETKFVVER